MAERLGQRGSRSRSVEAEKKNPRRVFGGAGDVTRGFLGSLSGKAEFESNKKGRYFDPLFQPSTDGFKTCGETGGAIAPERISPIGFLDSFG